MARFAVLGHGAWGGALGQSFARAGHDVAYWTRNGDAGVVEDATIIFAAVPAQATRQVISGLAPAIPRSAQIVLTAKGLERATLSRQSEILADILPGQPFAVLSGPSFARDLGAGLPTAVTLATTCRAPERLQHVLATGELRPYLSDDVIGAELGGALKNVIAIGCGAAIGAGLGESARAALMARGFSEIVAIARAAGARPETLAGLSGLGDLTLTCTSDLSRNFRYGRALGETGAPPGNGTYEGVSTAEAAETFAARHGIPAPVIATLAGLVTGQLGVREAIDRLYARPLRRE